MGFGRELQAWFARATTGGRRGEVALFRALQAVFHDLEARYPACLAAEIHGGKSIVSFTSQEHYVERVPPGRSVRCELGDLHLAAVSPSRKRARVTFMQNKVRQSGPPDLGFRADLVQLELLKTRAAFCRDGVLDEVLSAATHPSVACYGVFFPDRGHYDMQYYSAHQVEPFFTRKKGRVRMARYQGVLDVFSMTEDQFDGCSGLEVFGDAFSALQIGEPMKLPELIRRLPEGERETLVGLLRRADTPVEDGEWYREEAEPPLWEAVGTTVFLNADRWDMEERRSTTG